MIKIKEVSYEEERLRFFIDKRNSVQKRYDRLEKTITSDEPYLSDRLQLLSDYGRELSFYNDVIKMIERDAVSNSDIQVS